MSTRRDLLLGLSIGLLAIPLASLAQKPAKVWRVGFLAPARRPEIYGGLTERLGELGYVEGRNLIVEWRFADGDYKRLPELAAELVALPVDILVTTGVPGTAAAEKATRTIPIVFLVGGAVLEGHFVDSLAHPGRNATGMAGLLKGLSAKQLDMLTRIVPKLSRVAVLTNPDNQGHVVQLESLRELARAAGLEIVPVQARTPKEIEEAFSRVTLARAGALMWIADPFLDQQMPQIADLSAWHRLPSVTSNSRYAAAGGLMNYGSIERENWRHIADFVDKILKGANPGNLPVEQPTKFEFVINKKTAKALGLTIPPELLLLADKVIE